MIAWLIVIIAGIITGMFTWFDIKIPVACAFGFGILIGVEEYLYDTLKKKILIYSGFVSFALAAAFVVYIMSEGYNSGLRSVSFLGILLCLFFGLFRATQSVRAHMEKEESVSAKK